MSIQQPPVPLESLQKPEPLAVLKNEPPEFEFAQIDMDDIFDSSNEEIMSDIKDTDIVTHILCEDSIKSETVQKNILKAKHSESTETQEIVKTEHSYLVKIESIAESETLNITEDTEDRSANKDTDQRVIDIQAHIQGANENIYTLNNLETNIQLNLNSSKDLNGINNCTDIVDWLASNSFSSLNIKTKLYIVKTLGKPKPNLVSLKSSGSDNRGFHTKWYEKCDWITGSSVRAKLFCWPCLLFAKPTKPTSWTKTGFSDLKNLSRSADQHGKSKEHIASRCKIKLFFKENIATDLDGAGKQAIISYNKLVKENRSKFKKVIDAVIFLSSQGLSFDNGNYKELLLLFGTFDSNLNSFLESNIFSETSNTIQNDLIESVSFVLKEQIKKEIQEVAFYAWQVDETTMNISCGSQHSIVFRYVTKGEIVERFMGFYDVSGRTAEDLFNFLISECDPYDFKKKLVAQTYDGAAVIAGHLNVLQIKIKSVAPQALFTHCHAHALNLVLSQACNSIKDCRIFFASLSGFDAFFSKSTKRINVLNEISYATSFNFTSRSVFTIHKNRKKLIQVFNFIINSDDFKNDVESIRESVGLKSLLNDEKFCFLLETFKLIFEQSEAVENRLTVTDIEFSKQPIIQLIQTLKTYQSNGYFNNFYESIVESDSEPLQKKRKSQLDLPDLKNPYKHIFEEIIDTVIAQIETRFCNLEKLDFFDLLAFKKFKTYSKSFPQNLLDNLLVQYPFFDLLQLKTELSVLYNEPQIFDNCKTPSELLRFIYQNDLITCMPELYKFVSVVITIPVSSGSVERNLSALERIQHYSQNTQLSSNALVAIEKELAREMCQDNQFYENVIDYFARTKNQRIALTFKAV